MNKTFNVVEVEVTRLEIYSNLTKTYGQYFSDVMFEDEVDYPEYPSKMVKPLLECIERLFSKNKVKGLELFRSGYVPMLLSTEDFKVLENAVDNNIPFQIKVSDFYGEGQPLLVFEADMAW